MKKEITGSKPKNSNLALIMMMFMQYMMFAVWWVPLAAYLTNMGIGGTQKSLILSSMAIGCMASPLIGMIADRYFDGKKVLAALNLLNSFFLLLAALTKSPDLLFLFLLLGMLCYMPTWSLTSSIALTHSGPEKFSRIRVFGSIGWVASGVFSLIVVNLFKVSFDGTHIPLFFASGIGIATVFANFFLPSTPPKVSGKKNTIIDALGFRTIRLMKDRNIAVFIVLSFLAMIPFSMYWSYCSEFLLDRNFKYISVTMNFGQLAEMLFLLIVPFSIRKVGLHGTMVLGLLALLIRYVAFYLGSFMDLSAFYFLGILVHGLIFAFFYLGGQIYIDQKAPAELKSQAQGFIFFVTFGLGLLVGNFVNGQIIGHYSSFSGNNKVYDWNNIWAITTYSSTVLLLAFMVFHKKEKKQVPITSPDRKNIVLQDLT